MDGDGGAAGGPQAEVEDEVVLDAVVAVAAAHLLALGAGAGGDLDAGADGGAVGAGSAFEAELEPVAAVGGEVLEVADAGGGVAVVGRVGVAAGAGKFKKNEKKM